MRKIQRLAAVGALAALTVALGACSSEEEPAAGGDTAAEETTAAPEESSGTESESMAPGGDGVTTTDDIFGPGCSDVPTEGPGSPDAMVEQPVGDAASTNPLLTTLTAAVTAGGLVDTLNDTSAAYTVFAPADSAFEALEASMPGVTEQLTTAPNVTEMDSDLNNILLYHVIGERMDAEGIVAAGTLPSVQGGDVMVTGTADAPIVNGANVACGNIPTANATVFVIDQVMSPPA